MNSSVEDIKSRINIVDFIGEYVKLQKAGVNWKALCPFHNEKTPSFVVSEEKQIWHCFGCGKGGDIFSFLMEMEGVDFKEALKVLAEKAGVELARYGYNPQAAASKNRTLEILELASKFYEKQLWDGSGKEKILGYLRERSLKDKTIKEFRLGYAPPGWRNILKFLINRGYGLEEILKTGLLVQRTTNNEQQTTNNEQGNSCYDRFRNRIIFPIADVMGRVVGFSARVAPGGDESQAKYVNTPETEAYHKSAALYGIDKAKQEIKDKKFVLLVEGNMDVIASHQAGIKNTVAVSGTALTPRQLDILKRYSGNIKMFFDMDEAGQAAALRSAELAFQKDINVSIVRLEKGKDAADAVKENPKEFLEAVKNSVLAMEYFFRQAFEKHNKDSARGKKMIAEELLNIIKNFSNEIEKTHWVKKLAQRLEVDEKILLDTLNKAAAREFIGKANRENEEDEGEFLAEEKKSKIIGRKIIGLALANPRAWKKIVKEEANKFRALFRSDGLFMEILTKGAPAEFGFEKFLTLLDNETQRKIARKLYFEARYQFEENQEIKENSLKNSWPLIEQYLKDVEKELYKEKLKAIIKDIEKAEKAGDKNMAGILMKEFSKISKKLK
ncbi:DNA primase [bacterium]|nr:DNA primase [bacterium]